MSVTLAGFLKLAPLAKAEFDRYRRSKPALTLNRLVRAELENDPALGTRATDSLINEWFYLHNDPRGAVLIAGLLASGQPLYLEALRVRAAEILEGLDDLPFAVGQVADRLVAAVTNNFVAAQKDELTATQRGTSAIFAAVESRPTSGDIEEIVRRSLQDFSPAPTRVVLLATSFGDSEQRHLTELHETLPEAAGRLAELLDARGVNGLDEEARSPSQRTVDEPARFWRAAAKILTDAGRLVSAQAAYEHEAGRPDADDPAAAFVNAARCAEASAAPDAEGAVARLVEQARGIRDDHPLVKLFDADREQDAEQRLAAVDAVETENATQAGRKDAQRAQTLLVLGRYEDAHASATASMRVLPHGAGGELAAVATIMQEHGRLPLRGRDDRPLMDAIAYELSLMEKGLRTGRTGVGGLAGARAALGAAILDDRRAAAELIDRIAEDPTLNSEEGTRTILYEAAITLGDGERARRVLSAPDNTPASRLAHATVELAEGSDDEAAKALDALIADVEPGPIRSQAVVMRILAADDPGALDSALYADVDSADRVLAHAKASRAMARDDFGAARSILVHLDDPRSLVLRAEVADRDNALPEAIGLLARVVRRHPTAQHVLRLAGLRARTGDYVGAIRDALRIATDDRKVTSSRDRAYHLAAQAAIDGDEFEELEDLSERWAELSQDRTDPLWAHIFALARQGRQDEALAFAREQELEPTLDASRHLLWADLLSHGLTGSRRMRALMELSDRFDRPMDLELAFIMGVLATPPTERGDENPAVIERFQESLSTFGERFPDSTAIKQFTFDDDEDGAAILDRLAAESEPTRQETVDLVEESIDGVRQGRTAMSFVAGLVSKSTAETLVRNGAFPLTTPNRGTADEEIAAATLALEAAAASWDETACVTIGLLGAVLGDRVFGLLPASVIGQTARDVLSIEAKAQPAGEQVATLQILPDGTPRIVEEDPEVVARVRLAEASADEVAGRLAAVSDAADTDDQLKELLSKHNGRPGPIEALASAFLASRSRSLPLFSDDRVVRAYARGFGIPAFGTFALIDAAQARGLVDASEAHSYLEPILDLGVWSPALSPELYVATARRARFSLNRCGRALLADEVMLRADARVEHNARLLAALATESTAETLDAWAKTMLTAYEEILGLEPRMIAGVLAGGQLDPAKHDTTDGERQRNMAVIEALRRAVDHDPDARGTDPLEAGFNRWLHTIGDHRHRAAATENLLAQVDGPSAEHLRTFLTDDADPS